MYNVMVTTSKCLTYIGDLNNGLVQYLHDWKQSPEPCGGGVLIVVRDQVPLPTGGVPAVLRAGLSPLAYRDKSAWEI